MTSWFLVRSGRVVVYHSRLDHPSGLRLAIRRTGIADSWEWKVFGPSGDRYRTQLVASGFRNGWSHARHEAELAADAQPVAL